MENGWGFPFAQGQESLAGLAARQEILTLGTETVTAVAGEQIELVVGYRVRQAQFPAILELDQRGGRHAVALAAGNVGGGDGVGAAEVVEDDQRIDGAARDAGEQAVAGAEGELCRVDVVARARA
ncbi:hypothetical protein SDC9_107514 [bioreactor metagenome]|uniref:Uncharacterized protein n=1 Tax=bioreactor metagenome TaxID=1076179 RepID=A0A645B5G6_9ZZZZ